MSRNMTRLAVMATGLIALSAAYAADSPKSAGKEVRRGEYLVNFGGCHDCHTPKKMTSNGPEPDMSRALSGSPAQWQPPAVPQGALAPDGWIAMTNNDLSAWAGPWGISFAANLTPDKETGIGNWTETQFVRTMRTGKHLGVGRPILPPMPWQNLNSLNDQDLRSVYAYLKSIKPIANRVPAPVAPR